MLRLCENLHPIKNFFLILISIILPFLLLIRMFQVGFIKLFKLDKLFVNHSFYPDDTHMFMMRCILV